MNLRYFLLCFFLGMLMGYSATLSACDAYPYPIQFIQPDSSKIEIIMMGDEKLRWAETTDGFSILFDKNGVYVYAMQDKEGNMIA